MPDFIIQIIGYTASVLLAISLLVTNDLKFRWFNTFGCFSFIAYGILIGALPIVLTNAFLLLINLFYLIKIYKRSEDFDLIEFDRGDKFVEKFLSFYALDISAYFPRYTEDIHEDEIRFVVLRDTVIANVFIATLDEDGNAIVKLNYTVPKYRDYKVGQYIFEKEKKYLISKGVKKISYEEVGNKNHEDFLKTMGFQKPNSNDFYLSKILK